MENQHRKIKGYRELSQEEINLMNEVKQKGIELGALCKKLSQATQYDPYDPDADIQVIEPDQRWLSIGKTHLQQGIMALTRAIAKPDFF